MEQSDSLKRGVFAINECCNDLYITLLGSHLRIFPIADEPE